MSKNFLCFLGSPASGKGSYTKLVMETLHRLKVPSVEKMVASDLIKREVKLGTATGKKMDPYMKQHKHVPAELMVETLLRNVEAAGSRSIILDGFPRTVEQAEIFRHETSSSESSRGPSPNFTCIHLDIKREWARAKAVGRLNCAHCDFPYNDARIEDGDFVWEADLPAEAKCGRPDCGFPQSLKRRDSGEVFDGRYALYLKDEVPVLDFLKKFYPAKNIEIRGGYRVMCEQIMQETINSLGLEGIDGEDMRAATHGVLDEWGQ